MFRAKLFGLFCVLILISTLPGFAGVAADDVGGAVFVMSNSVKGNTILRYERHGDGKLVFDGAYATGGAGVGADIFPEDPLGSQSPIILSPDKRWLLAVNAKSKDISVFRVMDDGLKLMGKRPSGGEFPVSLAMRWNIVYVLNAGGDANIVGFTLSSEGKLVPMRGAGRKLGTTYSIPPNLLESPAQVAFSADGRYLAVTEKSNRIHVFTMNEAGIPSLKPMTTISKGNLPFGFAFDRQNRLLISEAFGTSPVGDANASAVSSYDLMNGGQLQPISPSVDNFQTASCWLTLVNDQYVYTTNNGNGTISGYELMIDGSLQLLEPGGIAAVTGENPVDLAATQDGSYLYALNTTSGTISMYAIGEKGALTELGQSGGILPASGAAGLAVY